MSGIINSDGSRSGVIGLRLDGRQPGFYAYGGSGVVSVSNAAYVVLTNDSTLPAFDTGSNYDTSTGKFTTPVAGKYIFGFAMYNITTDVYVWSITDGTTTYARQYNTPTAVNMDYGFSVVCDVEAGKAIGVQNNAEGGAVRSIYQSTPVHSRFWGYLLG